MIPTFSDKIKSSILVDYLGSNLVACLINYPELGLTDIPTENELLLRKQLDINFISDYELGKNNLRGYTRQIVSILESSISGDTTKEATLTIEFNAGLEDFEEATHILLIRGAKLTEATENNGNNRGSTQGTIIYVEPLLNAPLVVQANSTFEYTFTLSSGVD